MDCKLCPQEWLIKSSCSHWFSQPLKCIVGMNIALKGSNVMLLRLAHRLCHSALVSLPEHLLYTSSTLRGDGNKKVKVEFPLQWSDILGTLQKVFHSVNVWLLPRYPKFFHLFSDDGWPSLWRIMHESCCCTWNGVRPYICSYITGMKGKHL